MIHFVGAGSGAADLITLRGKKFLEDADVVIYAGSLVNPQLLEYTKPGCAIYNSAKMTLEEVLEVMFQAEKEEKMTVRLHTGDPCLYGAIREQWTCWTKRKLPMIIVRVSALSVVQRQRLIWNIPFLMCHRALLLREWQAGHLCLPRRVLSPLRHTRQPW